MRGNVGKSSRYVVIPVSFDQNVILTPLQREKRQEERERRKKEREGEEAVAGRTTINKSPPPIYPPEMFQSTGRLGPGKNTAGDGFYQGGTSRNSSRAFPRIRVFWKLMKSRAGAHLPNNPSLVHLAHYNRSSESALSTPPGSSSE